MKIHNGKYVRFIKMDKSISKNTRSNSIKNKENDDDNDVYTGAREMLKITKLLKQNNYEYNGEYKCNWYNYRVLEFTKPIKYTDWDGNWINDNHITIRVEYSRNYVMDKPINSSENNEDDENEKPINEEMIKQIIDGIEPPNINSES